MRGLAFLTPPLSGRTKNVAFLFVAMRYDANRYCVRAYTNCFVSGLWKVLLRLLGLVLRMVELLWLHILLYSGFRLFSLIARHEYCAILLVVFGIYISKLSISALDITHREFCCLNRPLRNFLDPLIYLITFSSVVKRV